MLFENHGPYSKFSEDGLITVNWPKHVANLKIKYTVVFDKPEIVLLSFSFSKVPFNVL
jgi:hypothetical protein